MKKRILLVDDDISTRQAVFWYLVEQGHEVIEAGTTKEAIAIIRRSEIDLILWSRQTRVKFNKNEVGNETRLLI